LSAETVNTEPPVLFAYDNDGLLTQAGDLTLTYNSSNQQLAGTTLQTVTDSFTYNSYGEVVAYTAMFGSTVLFDVSYVRDNLGRITAKTETIENETNTFEYGYDSLGQLTSVTIDSVLARQYVYDANGNRVAMI